MRSILLGLLAFASGSGCIHVHVHTHGQLRGGHGLEPGDRVVTRWSTTLYEATVITVDGKLVTIEWDDGSGKARRRVDSLARVGTPTPSLSPGQWVLCRAASWAICLAKHSSGGPVAVWSMNDGAMHDPQTIDVLTVPEALVDWVETSGNAQIRHWEAQAHWQGVRPRNAGKQVGVGQRVIAAYAGDAWYEATVKAVNEGAITVEWTDGSGGADQERADVAPLTNDHGQLGPGDFVFCKWAGGHRWWRAEVKSRDDSRLSVAYIDGTHETLPTEKCAPAARPK